MKLCFVYEYYHPHVGGGEVLLQHLAEGMAARGHECTVVTSRLPGTQRREQLNGVAVRRVRVPRRGDRYWFTLLGLPAVMAEVARADVVHAPTYNGAIPSWLAGRARRKPVVLHPFEVLGPLWMKLGVNPVVAAGFLAFEKMVLRLPFDSYGCISEHTRQALLRGGVPGGKAALVYPGIDYGLFHTGGGAAGAGGQSAAAAGGYGGADETGMGADGSAGGAGVFAAGSKGETGGGADGSTGGAGANPGAGTSGRAEIRARLGVDDDTFLCLYSGRPGFIKGVEFLVRAIPEIRRRVPAARLLFLLSPRPETKFREVSRELSRFGDEVIVRQPVPRAELPGYFAASDCVVVPSINEGFGFTCVEACTMGVPVVASNAGSLPEVISGSYVLVAPRSPAAIAAGVERVFRGQAEQTPLKRFTWDDAIDRHLAICEQLLADRRRDQASPGREAVR